MIACPLCESKRVVVVLAPSRRAFCAHCGARWIQEGSYQRAVRLPKNALLNPGLRGEGVR